MGFGVWGLGFGFLGDKFLDGGFNHLGLQLSLINSEISEKP